MKIHIIGAGPGGMSLAWEIIHSGENHDVTIYDRKLSAGGSWWEPDTDLPDLHAHRIVFDKAFVNTQSLFSEMDIEWGDIFQKVEKTNTLNFAFKSLNVKDYGTLISLFYQVLAKPSKFMSISLKDAVGPLSENGEKYIEHLPLIMDGVTWNVMTAYEFVKNIDHTILSNMYTQKVSGKVMCDAMEEALVNAGVNFVFGTELVDIEYGEDSFVATFSDETIIDDGMLFLCVDNSPALKLLGDNWGDNAEKQIRGSTYGAINVLIDYDELPKLKSDLELAIETKWNLQPKILHGTNTISCVICDLTEDILKTNPIMLKLEVIDQLKLPEPKSIRIGWGAEWDEDKWVFTQSSGVISKYGQLPFFGKSSKVAMCGMMSPRNTPYSSIEAAIEVSRNLSNKCFGTRKSLKPVLFTQILMIIILLLIVLILVYRNINQ